MSCEEFNSLQKGSRTCDNLSVRGWAFVPQILLDLLTNENKSRWKEGKEVYSTLASPKYKSLYPPSPFLLKYSPQHSTPHSLLERTTLSPWWSQPPPPTLKQCPKRREVNMAPLRSPHPHSSPSSSSSSLSQFVCRRAAFWTFLFAVTALNSGHTLKML